ncbi:MAG: ParB/RepB/Spo0J family partition protein [Gemmataceae bacterium]|nr:ParB/RepB/Spo0J family partition protein [Gemmataceae bacterium]
MTAAPTAKVRLGRGLDALLGPAADAPLAAAPRVPVDQIHENPFQPRKVFDAEELAGLRDSIREYGVLQPIVVRSSDEGYQLIAGERRLRAAKEAGLTEIPVSVVDFTDQQTNEAALVENIQRADLNPIEKAQGFKDYLERFSMTQEQLAERLGIDRTSISNLLGLLNLPGDVQDYVRTGQLTLGHAKILKGLHDAPRSISLAKEVISRGLSVHGLEALLKQQRAEAGEAPPAAGPRQSLAERTAHILALEEELRGKLAATVQIKLKSKEKGQIVIPFDSNSEFERLLEVLRR